ncbi:hypothetical protein G9C98_001776, partial [Cotesia typhae]
MLAKSAVILFALAVGLSSLSNGKSTVSANAIPSSSRLSFDIGDDFDDYYKYIGNFYRSGIRKDRSGPVTYQYLNTLQQVKSKSENYMGSEVNRDKIVHENINTVVDNYSGALTLQVDNTWQRSSSNGTNYIGSQTRQKN